MDMEILKKRISSYRTPKGRLTRVPDELLVDILKAWEQWTGPGSAFYSALGADHRKMALPLTVIVHAFRSAFLISLTWSPPIAAIRPTTGRAL